MSTLLQEIEAQIGAIRTATTRTNVGVIRELGDGVARVEGLSDVMLNEMLDLGRGVTGLALRPESADCSRWQRWCPVGSHGHCVRLKA